MQSKYHAKNSAVFELLFFSIAKVQFRMPLCERDVSAKENICKLWIFVDQLCKLKIKQWIKESKEINNMKC